MATREEKMEAFGQLLDILDELRVKCPWDRKQTNESLRTNTIEKSFYSAHRNGKCVVFNEITVNIPYFLIYSITPYDSAFILYKHFYNIEFISRYI